MLFSISSECLTPRSIYVQAIRDLELDVPISCELVTRDQNNSLVFEYGVNFTLLVDPS